jgi:hypothetical protein
MSLKHPGRSWLFHLQLTEKHEVLHYFSHVSKVIYLKEIGKKSQKIVKSPVSILFYLKQVLHLEKKCDL